MNICNRSTFLFLFVFFLLITIDNYSQELPEPPEPPEVEVEPPKFVGKIIEAVGTGLGISDKSKKNKEASRINEKTLHEIELIHYQKKGNRFSFSQDTIYNPNIDSLNFTVMGWNPFWLGDAYKTYSYNLLSDISYYSYELDPTTGGYETIHDWNTTSMIDLAKSHDCNVYLTMSSYGKANNKKFLKNKKAQKKSIQSLIQLLKYREAHGVTVDMHPIPSTKSTEFTSYINSLSTALHREGFSLNLVLPPVYQEHTFDIASLVANIDLFIIMGYGYHPTDSKKAGPLSPMFVDDSWRFFSLNSMIDQYLEQGIPAQKTIVSLPYLGTEWTVKNPKIPSLKSEHIRYFPFNVKDQFSDAYQFELDPLSYSFYTTFPSTKGKFKQVWLDDKNTLRAKYQLIIDKGFKGITIWSLGYDNGSTVFWGLIEEVFAEPKNEEVVKTIEEIQKEEMIEATSLLDSLFEEQLKIQDSANQLMSAKIESVSEKIEQISDFTDHIVKKDSLFDDADHLKKEVFGWHPHWMGERYKSYNFKLLSTLAYFSYELNPETGGYKTIHDWATTSVIDSAHAKGTKVHLTVTNFGEENNRKFLNNYQAQRVFIEEIVKQIERRAADGVNLDFENIPKTFREKFTRFVIRLSERLQVEGLEFSMVIPSNDPDWVYDFNTLINFVDYFVMMGYNYHKDASISGPNAPLKSSAKWGKPSVENSVNTYFSRGIPPIQLIVAYPYYGIKTQTKSIKIPAESTAFLKEMTYSEIRNEFKKKPIIDLESSSAYYVIPSPSDEMVEQLWFDNEESFAMKCDWINQKKLRGVGIWALGFDHGNNELWTVLNQKFAKDPNEVILKTPRVGESFFFKVKHILNDINLNSNTVFMILIFLLTILFLGFCFAMTNSQVVDILFNHRLYQASFIILLLVIIVSLMELKSLISDVEVLFFAGGVLGIAITFILRRSVVESQKNKP
jgi:spore germination protein YaaH